MSNSEIVISALNDLRNAGKNYGANVKNLYGILLFGKKFNLLSSIDLNDLLKRQYGLDISNDELNDMLPVICKSNRMKCVPRQNVKYLNNQVCDNEITLF